jgi:predicted dehydrogenase
VADVLGDARRVSLTGAPGWHNARMTRAEIGWGIIGCGDVVLRKSGPALATAPGSRIAAVMRRDPAKLREAAGLLRAPFATTDAAELIARPEVNAVYIAAPPQHHLEYALAVARAGKACLVEKPAGRSDRELEQMMRAFAQAGVPLYVSYYRRFLARSAAVREVLRSGRLGPLVSVDYRLAKTPREAGWRLSAQSGGGLFHDLAGHVLDLFDDWFGPLELTGASAGNVLAAHETEDAVSLSFRGADGLVGAASWDFAAAEARDELVIEGLRGSLRLGAMSTSGPVLLSVKPASEAVVKSLGARLIDRLQGRGRKAPRREHLRFAKDEIAHLPLVRKICEDLRAGGAPASPAAALRSARLVNQALDRFYGGRADDFWNHPERFDNARARASRRNAGEAGYRLSPEELARFDEQGYLGPFRCDADWRRIAVPLKKRRDVHLRDPSVFDVCTHPSVVRRAAQLLRLPRVALFKSRFHVKLPGKNEEVPWHQDVGAKNGGYYPDGRPVPSVTCWMALDRVSAENGAVQVLPGSHKRLIGDFRKNFHAELLKTRALTKEDLAAAVTLNLEPGEFYFFHSWLVHGSAPSSIAVRRAGLNMRYVAPDDRYEPECLYIPLDCSRQAKAAAVAA